MTGRSMVRSETVDAWTTQYWALWPHVLFIDSAVHWQYTGNCHRIESLVLKHQWSLILTKAVGRRWSSAANGLSVSSGLWMVLLLHLQLLADVRRTNREVYGHETRQPRQHSTLFTQIACCVCLRVVNWPFSVTELKVMASYLHVSLTYSIWHV